MNTTCTTPKTIDARIRGYLADGNVSDGELFELAGALQGQPKLSEADALALAGLVGGHSGRMSPWAGMVVRFALDMLPLEQKVLVDVAGKASDGRVTVDEVRSLLAQYGTRGLSAAERKALSSAVTQLGGRFDPDARALMQQALSNTCADSFEPAPRPKLFGIF